MDAPESIIVSLEDPIGDIEARVDQKQLDSDFITGSVTRGWYVYLAVRKDDVIAR